MYVHRGRIGTRTRDELSIVLAIMLNGKTRSGLFEFTE